MKNDEFADTHKLQRYEVKGAAYTHVIYTSLGRGGSDWHVYIEGDGNPWISRVYIASDPTPLEPLMLGMMASDPAPSIYLGRPCYHGMSGEAACGPWAWTSGRYSERVVDSMEKALKKLIVKYSIQNLVLIGHSGGGALAILLAARVPEVTTLITLAGNLDIAAWTEKHHYSPLEDSYNPALQSALPRVLRQFHYLGSEDQNIAREASQAAVEKISGTKLIILGNTGHIRGWMAHRCLIFAAAGFDCQ